MLTGGIGLGALLGGGAAAAGGVGSTVAPGVVNLATPASTAAAAPGAAGGLGLGRLSVSAAKGSRRLVLRLVAMPTQQPGIAVLHSKPN
jgi:hypothetical protein